MQRGLPVLGYTRSNEAGVTLIDTIVGIALMMIVFVGIVGAFKLGVDVVENNKARAGAIALADERMEYVRSLSYTSIGTVSGIPSGTIPQSESVILNGITYTRRTVVDYEDDPTDGLGASDSNGIVEDYKAVKVDVAWQAKSGARHITIVGRFTPATLPETNPCGSPCGEISISAVNASGAALPGVSVSFTNPSTTPAIAINTFTNASGTASIIGALAATGYQVVVSQAGYSTAQTYNTTAQNTNPTPGNLTVAQNQTTSATFAIDALGTKTIQLYKWINGQSTTTVASVAFTLQGSKTIGSGPSGLIYKYSANLTTDSSGNAVVPNLEWDSYAITIPSSSGYDIASACNPQPESLSPGASQTSTLYLIAHTSNSLLVDVRNGSSGTLLQGAYVQVSKTGFSAATTTDQCGQAFFGGLTASGSYTVAAGASGHATSSTSNVNVSGASRFSVQLN